MKSVPCLLFLALLLAPAAGIAGTLNSEAQRHFEEAMRLLHTNQPPRAIEELRRAIELDETFIEAHRERQDHILLLDDSRRGELTVEYRRRLEARPKSADNHYLFARLVEGAEHATEFQKALELDPNHFYSRMALAVLFRISQKTKSDEELRLAINACPQSGDAHAYLASTLYDLRKFSLAQGEAERARKLGINPHLADVLHSRISDIPARRTYHLIAFLAYLFALAVCAVMLAWSVRPLVVQKRAMKDDLFGIASLSFCCFWYLCWFILAARGDISTDSTYGLFNLAILLCNVFWPGVVYHMFYWERSAGTGHHRIFRYALYYFYVCALGLTGVLLHASFALWSYRFRSAAVLFRSVNFVFLANFVLCSLLCLILLVRSKGAKKARGVDAQARASRNWQALMMAFWLFLLWPVLIASLLGVISMGHVVLYLGLLATLMPLAFIVLETYHVYRYIFIDLFIKNAGAITVTSLVTAAYYVFVVRRYARGDIWGTIEYPEVLLLLPLIIAVPFVAGGFKRIVDKYVFKRRLAPAELLASFSREIRSISDEAELLQVAKTRLCETFHSAGGIACWFATEAKDGCAIPGVFEELGNHREPVAVNDLQQNETARFCEENGLEILVPIAPSKELRGCIALGKRHYNLPYLSEDLKLIASVADHLEFALENIALERRRREQDAREQELKLLASKAEFRALRAQINPHFLFNALNTIAALARKDPNRAEETVEMLAEVFRYSLARSGREFISLADEIDFISAYLEIEKARFGEKLGVEMRVEPDTRALKIPAMLLQPLVENAVKHGISPRVEGGKVIITSSCKNGLLKLEVTDTGIGFDVKSSKRLFKDGIGVRNVRDRLQAVYGAEGRLEVKSEPGKGATFSITLPSNATAQQTWESEPSL